MGWDQLSLYSRLLFPSWFPWNLPQLDGNYFTQILQQIHSHTVMQTEQNKTLCVYKDRTSMRIPIIHENNTKYYIYLYRFDWRFINKDSLKCVTHQSKAQDIFMIIITYRLFNGMPTGILWPNNVRSYAQIIFKQHQYWSFKDANRLTASYKLNWDKDVTIKMKKKNNISKDAKTTRSQSTKKHLKQQNHYNCHEYFIRWCSLEIFLSDNLHASIVDLPWYLFHYYALYSPFHGKFIYLITPHMKIYGILYIFCFSFLIPKLMCFFLLVKILCRRTHIYPQ